jgi:hypothetical protein
MTMTNYRRLPLLGVLFSIAAAVIVAVVTTAVHIQSNDYQTSRQEYEVAFAERRRRLSSLTDSKTNRQSSSDTSNHLPLDDHHHQLLLLQRYNSNNPILVLGLPRSGSLAVHNFFTCNGMRSSHYCCSKSTEKQASHDYDNNNNAATAAVNADHNVPISFPCRGGHDDDDKNVTTTTCGARVHQNMQLHQSPFQDCGDYQVYSQFDVETGDPFAWFLPQHFGLPLLHEAYPDSTWILNRRGSSLQWATNVLHWYSVTNRILNSFGVDYYANNDNTKPSSKNHNAEQRATLTQGDLVHEIQTSFARMHNETDHARRLQSLQDIYQRHLEKVRAYAQATSHALIEINVDEPVIAGETLDRAFLQGTTSSMRGGDCFQFDAALLDNDWKNFR